MGRYTKILVQVALALLVTAGCQTPEKAAPPAKAKPKPLSTRKVWNFDTDPPGKLPPGWEPNQTRPSTALATWAVVADGSAPSGPNVLALTKTDNQRPTFNLAIARQTTYKDLDLTVKVKGNTGQIDQGGGPIWRCRDSNNYYVCRINPLEGNYRVYKVVNSKRTKLASADVEIESGKWYTLRVTMRGDQMVCYLDGKKLLEAGDPSLPEAGMVGLWTKADAATAFDDLIVAPITGP